MFFGIIVGIVVGFVFKPQINIIVQKVLKAARKNMAENE